MVLSRLTKITGPGIRTDTNWVGNNANYTGILTAASLGGIGDITATGIITAASFSGDGSGLIGVASTDNIITGTAATFNTYPVDINAGMTVAGVATFAGNVSIAGTLTYEDVTNIDSVGIITGKGADINGDLDVDGHTNLDNVSIAGVVTATDLTVEKTGNLNVNIKSTSGWGALEVGGSVAGYIDIKKPFSDDYDMRLMCDGTNNYISSNARPLKLAAQGAYGIELGAYGAPSLQYNNDTKLTTTIKGIQVGTGVTIETNGQATFVGIVTFGSSSTTINGNTDTVNVGTALTIGHSQGLQYHTQNLHAQGFEVNQINASGIITATTFSGSGASLTNLNGSNIASGTVPVARIGTGTKNTSTFYRGDGTFATVTAPAITAINSASNNRIVTSDGGTTVTAESTLTYNGSGTLEINDSGSSVTIRGAGVTKHEMAASASDSDLVFVHNKDQGNITSNIIFKGSGAGGESIKERLRIDSGGRVQIGGVTGPNNAKLFVAGTNSTNYVTIRNTSAADSSGSRWSSVRFQGTQSGGEVSDLVHLQANHEGSSDDQKGAFQIQINDGNDGDSLQERMHLYSTNSTSQPIVKFISSNSGEMLNLQNSSGGGQGMVFGVDTSGGNDTTYLRNNTSAHFDFTFYMGSVSSSYERIRIKQDEFRNSTQFYSNKTAIASNKTITTSYNHMTIGNITINSGVTVTVNSGARWVIV